MSSKAAIFLTFAVAALVIPGAAAQVNTGSPNTGCVKNCNARAANPGDLPKTGTDSVKEVLYLHYKDTNSRGLINAQPVDAREPKINAGSRSPTLDTYTGTDSDVHFQPNWYRAMSSAGLVEIAPDGTVRDHQEPGLAIPLKVKGDNILLYWYLSAHPIPGQSTDTPPAGSANLAVMPAVGIYARIETGRTEFHGRLLAEGDTAKDDGNVPTSPNRVTIISVPGQPDIYEFEVPMAVKMKEWPDFFSDGGGAGFLLSVNHYQIKAKDSGTGQGTQAGQMEWRMHAGHDTPPRIVVDVENPMVTKAGSLTIFNDAMFVRWSIISPLGSYDVDDLTIKATLMGPKEVSLAKVGLAEPLIIKRSLDHDGHFLPINTTWKFDYKKGELPDGEYMIHLAARNFQGSYELQHVLTFNMKAGVPVDVPLIGALREGGGESTVTRAPPPKDGGILPNLGVAAASLALAGAAWLRRRDF